LLIGREQHWCAQINHLLDRILNAAAEIAGFKRSTAARNRSTSTTCR
jgi:hypothetical protein